MATVFGYGRQSDPDPKSPDSPAIQEDQIRRHFDSKLAPDGYEFGGCFIDLGISGAKPFATRPQGAILARKLDKGDAVIFPKLDRGFRDTFDMLQTYKAWEARGVRMIFLDLGVDTGTPIGRVFITIAAAIATFERERIGERMRDFIRKRKAEGRPHSRPPYGFKHVGPKGQRKFAPDPEGRAVGKQILVWRIQGYTWEAIYWALVQRGERRPNGKEWSIGSIQRACIGEAKLQGLEARRGQGRKEKTEIPPVDPSTRGR